jgi:hypothetical protein
MKSSVQLENGLTPPAHCSFYGREAPVLAESIRHLDGASGEDIDPEADKENVEKF